MLHKNGKSCIEQFIRQCQCYFECGTSGHKGKGSERKKPDRSGEDKYHWWGTTKGQQY